MIGYATSCPGPWNVTSPPRPVSDDADTARAQVLVAGEDVLLLRAAAERDHRVVLEEQDDVTEALRRLDARLDERLLERVRAVVRDAPEPVGRDVSFVLTASDSSAPLP